MSFALYWLGEYANVLLMCALNAVLFWGGYLPPLDWAPLYWIPGWIWLFGKILMFFFIFSWVKATVPRYRYDQLMRLGWKVFLPVSLGFVVVVSGYLMWVKSTESSQMATGEPTVAMMTDLGATSVCRLRSYKDYGDRNKPSKNVYISRDWRETQVGSLEIKYPSELAGRATLELTKTNGYGGSGLLRWEGQSKHEKLGMTVTDMILTDGPASIMFLGEGQNALVGDCIPKSELKA